MSFLDGSSQHAPVSKSGSDPVRKTLLLMGLTGVLAAPPSLGAAQPYPLVHSCWGHRVAGTVLGGVGGGAIGAALAAGVSVTPWAWAAAGVGALIGHAIGVHACHNHWRQAYYYGYYPAPPPEPYAYYHVEHHYYPAAYEYEYYRPAHHHHAVHYTTRYVRYPRG